MTSNPGIFDETLRISKDPELERLLLSEVIVSPPSLITKQGGPVLIGRLRNNDMTDGRTAENVCRMIFYTIDRVLQRPETQHHGITVIHDLRGFDRKKNVRIQLVKQLFRGLFGQFPVHITAIYICKPPPGIASFFSFMSRLLMSAKTRERVHFIDEFSKLNHVIDEQNLLTELGGDLEWSTREWIEEQKREEEEGTMVTLTEINPKN